MIRRRLICFPVPHVTEQGDHNAHGLIMQCRIAANNLNFLTGEKKKTVVCYVNSQKRFLLETYDKVLIRIVFLVPYVQNMNVHHYVETPKFVR